MRTIKVGFSRNRHDAIFSVLLQDYMDKPYSHCFIEFDTKEKLGDYSIYHSSLSSGVGYMSKSIFEEDNIIVYEYEIELTEEMFQIVRQELFSVCGRHYGLAQNLGIYIVDFFRKFNIMIKNPFVENQNCSELLYRHFIEIAYQEYIGKYDPNTISPIDIETIIKEIKQR